MMKTYARIYDGVVVELFSTDGDITEMFHSSFVWVDISERDVWPDYGWLAVETDGLWSFTQPEVIPPTVDQMKAEALAKRDYFMAIANESTTGMADAFIAGLLDEPDVIKFKSFAAYKLALNKIDKQPGYPGNISWPDVPSY